MNPLCEDVSRGQELCFCSCPLKESALFNPARAVQEVQVGFLSG